MRRIDIRSKQYEGLDRLKAQAELEASRKREKLRPIPAPVIKAGNVSSAARISQTEASLQTILTSLGLPDRPTYNWDDVAMLDLVSDRAAWQRAHEGMGWDVYIANTQYLLTTLEEDGRRRGETGAAGKARELRLLLERARKGETKAGTRANAEAAARAASEKVTDQWNEASTGQGRGSNSNTTTTETIMTGVTGDDTETSAQGSRSSDFREDRHTTTTTSTTTTDKTTGTTTTTSTVTGLKPKPGAAVPPDAAAGGAGGDAESKDADAASRAARALIPGWQTPYWLSWTTTVAGLATVAFGATAEMPIPEIGGLGLGLVGETLVVARACSEQSLTSRTPHALTLGVGGLAMAGAGFVTESMALLFMGMGGMAGAAIIQTHWGYLKVWGLVTDIEEYVESGQAATDVCEATVLGTLFSLLGGDPCSRGEAEAKRDPKKGTPKAGSSEQPEATRKRKRQAPQTQWR